MDNWPLSLEALFMYESISLEQILQKDTQGTLMQSYLKTKLTRFLKFSLQTYMVNPSHPLEAMISTTQHSKNKFTEVRPRNSHENLF